MKKLILIFALFGSLLSNAFTVDLTRIDISRDTSFVINHPNSSDSVLAVNIINGIVQILPVQVTFFRSLATPENVGAFVGFIFFLWRLIEKRKLRKNNILKDSKWRKMQTLLVFLLCLNFNASASIPLDSVLNWQKQASKQKIALSTYMNVREYAKLSMMSVIPNDSIKNWKSQASKFKLDLSTYMECLIFAKNSSSISGLTTDYVPVAASSTSLVNSKISTNSNGIVNFNTTVDGSGSGIPVVTFSSTTGGLLTSSYSQTGGSHNFNYYTNGSLLNKVNYQTGYMSLQSAGRFDVTDISTGKIKMSSHMSANGYISIGDDYFVPNTRLHVNGRITFENLPTSSVGLGIGEIYKDAGCTCIKYVP